MNELNLDNHSSHALSYNDVVEESGSNGAGIQSLINQTVPLSQLPRDEAIEFINKLYSPTERFAKGFYRYWRDTLQMPEKEAWQATLDELKEYSEKLIDSLDDPHYHTIGFEQQGKYLPIGLYGFRALDEHPVGIKLLTSMQHSGLINNYQGNLAIAHSYSALNGYRNRLLLKYAFMLIALEALENHCKHIFFFMSDHRLGSIYKRFGLEFPPNLTFPDSKHLVGCYSITPKHLEDIKSAAAQFSHPLQALPEFE